MRLRHMILLTVPLLMLSTLSHSDQETRAGEASDASALESPPPTQRRGRLRFRDGPVCMCSDGMSEEDIRRAERERREQSDR